MRPSFLPAPGAAPAAPPPTPARGASHRAAVAAERPAFEAALEAAAGERPLRETGDRRSASAPSEERGRPARSGKREADATAPAEGRSSGERVETTPWTPWTLRDGKRGPSDEGEPGESSGEASANDTNVVVDPAAAVLDALPMPAGDGRAGGVFVPSPDGAPAEVPDQAAAPEMAVSVEQPSGTGGSGAAQTTQTAQMPSQPAGEGAAGDLAVAGKAGGAAHDAGDALLESDVQAAGLNTAAPQVLARAATGASARSAPEGTTAEMPDIAPDADATASGVPPQTGGQASARMHAAASGSLVDGVPVSAGQADTAATNLETAPPKGADALAGGAPVSEADGSAVSEEQGALSAAMREGGIANELPHGGPPAAHGADRPAGVEASAMAAAAWRRADVDAPAQVAPELTSPPAEASAVVDQVVKSLRVQWKQGLGEARILLRPEHLGPVDVSIKVEGGAVTAVVRAESAQVQEWLLANQQSLRQQLEAAGLRLDDLVVSRDGERRRQQQDPTPDEQQRRARPRRHDGDRSEPTFSIVV